MSLFELSKPYIQHLYGTTANLQKIVCEECEEQWKPDKLIERTETRKHIYGLYRVNHPSPIHFTWK
jgi:hypothetical protein